MSLSLHMPWLLLIVAAVLGFSASYFVYRYTVPPATPGRRRLLALLRGAALSLLIFALGEPLLRLSRESTEKPAIAVLVDNSLSMSLTDEAGGREHALRSILGGAALRGLLSASQPEFYSISPSLRRLAVDSLRLTGTTTDLASALRSLKKIAPPELRAVLLLSDGDYNTGENPLTEAETFGTPIFTVGIGDSLEQKDIAVEKISTNSVAYVQSTVPLDAVVKVSGFDAGRLTARLLEDGREISRQEIDLSTQGTNRVREYRAHFTFSPTESGTRKFTVEIPSQAGEVTSRNNAKSVLVKVLKNKIKVAVIASGPGPDVSAVIQALRADPNIDASLAVQQPGGLPPAPFLSTAECIVLIGIPSAVTTESSLRSIAENLKRGVPLLFIASRTLNFQKLRLLDASLPFQVLSDKTDEQLVFPVVPAEEQYHVLARVGEALFDWSTLPPLYSSLGTFSAKPEALMIATASVSGIPLRSPLILASAAPQSKTIAVLGYGLWRWRLLAGASRETENFFDPWMSNVIRWLVTRDESQRVRVTPVRDVFAQGEPVELDGQVYDETYRPVSDAELRVEISSPPSNERFEAILQPDENGRYTGQIDALPEGEYSFTGVARVGTTEIGKTDGHFSVGAESIEYLDTKMNKALLGQMASVSGGEFATGGESDSLLRDISSKPFMKPGERTSTSEFELWNLPSLLSVIVALFGLEWFVRKRSGML